MRINWKRKFHSLYPPSRVFKSFDWSMLYSDEGWNLVFWGRCQGHDREIQLITRLVDVFLNYLGCINQQILRLSMVNGEWIASWSTINYHPFHTNNHRIE